MGTYSVTVKFEKSGGILGFGATTSAEILDNDPNVDWSLLATSNVDNRCPYLAGREKKAEEETTAEVGLGGAGIGMSIKLPMLTKCGDCLRNPWPDIDCSFAAKHYDK